MIHVLQEKMVKTRKAHYCSGCARQFPKGTEMQYQASVDGGDFFSYYLCPTCVDVVSDYLARDPSGFEFCYGDLIDDALEKERAEGVE